MLCLLLVILPFHLVCVHSSPQPQQFPMIFCIFAPEARLSALLLCHIYSGQVILIMPTSDADLRVGARANLIMP